MNDRIRELAEQCWDRRLDGLHFDKEMFAELIIQDVLNLFGDELISLHYLEQPCCEDAVYLLKSKVMDRFGVSTHTVDTGIKSI